MIVFNNKSYHSYLSLWERVPTDISLCIVSRYVATRNNIVSGQGQQDAPVWLYTYTFFSLECTTYLFRYVLQIPFLERSNPEGEQDVCMKMLTFRDTPTLRLVLLTVEL